MAENLDISPCGASVASYQNCSKFFIARAQSFGIWTGNAGSYRTPLGFDAGDDQTKGVGHSLCLFGRLFQSFLQCLGGRGQTKLLSFCSLSHVLVSVTELASLWRGKSTKRTCFRVRNLSGMHQAANCCLRRVRSGCPASNPATEMSSSKDSQCRPLALNST